MKKRTTLLLGALLLCTALGLLGWCIYDNTVDRSGWVGEADNLHYQDFHGDPVSGWQKIGTKRYYFDEGGIPATGWREIDGKHHHFREDGTPYVGWYSEGEYRYFLGLDGSPVTFPTEIDGETHYFSPQGIHVWLVNYNHSVPEAYETELITRNDGYQVAEICQENLQNMLDACAEAGHAPMIRSAYRTQEYQTMLYEAKVAQCGEEEAKTIVAVPGTSEHQLGLALDIVDSHYPNLDEHQAETETQQWLMEHCWEYGFILRYPEGATDITGIIYEPWHYRYVGVIAALEIRDMGVTLEEYLGAA